MSAADNDDARALEHQRDEHRAQAGRNRDLAAAAEAAGDRAAAGGFLQTAAALDVMAADEDRRIRTLAERRRNVVANAARNNRQTVSPDLTR